MIHIHCNLRNPWSDRFESIRSWHGSAIIPNKHWEIQFMRTNSWIGVDVDVSHRCDHAGINLEVSLFSYNISFVIYDERHWDYEKRCYTTRVDYNGSDFL
jgi:hypothetical protein